MVELNKMVISPIFMVGSSTMTCRPADFKPTPNREVWSRDGIEARIYYQDCGGVGVKTLLIRFPDVRRALSTMHGFVDVRYVCNNYAPPSLWCSLHRRGFRDSYFNELLTQLGVLPSECICLGTGVDMDAVAYAEEQYRDLWVAAFTTAGVKGNAMRAGYDSASKYEVDGEFLDVGTINIIVITNASLTDAAMARALITITEAKVAALQELDVRSSYNPNYQATGTGTDNAIIVSGVGIRITYTGGHSKAGELIARAVLRSVKEAVNKWERLAGS